MSEPRLVLKIDRIVLRGVAPGDERAFVDGLQSELKRILASPEARMGLKASGWTKVLRVENLTLQPGRAKALGTGVARAIGTRALGIRRPAGGGRA